MPRKKLEDLDKPVAAPVAETKPDAVVVSTADTTTRKVKLDLEVDTSVKDLGPNPFAKVIHLARAIDAWRICLENISTLVLNDIHYTVVQMCYLVYELACSNI